MHLFWIFALVVLSQSTISYRLFDAEFIPLIRFESSNENSIEDDPSDVVDVALWNYINEIERKLMPTITDYSSEKQAWNWYEWRTRITLRYYQVSQLLDFNYKVNITKENQQAIGNQSLITAPFFDSVYPYAVKFNASLQQSTDTELKKIFDGLCRQSVQQDPEYVKKVNHLATELQDIYSGTVVCEETDKTKCYQLSPYLERVMQLEKNYDRLLWAWKGWHDNCGNQIRKDYLEYIDLLSENVPKELYQNLADQWIYVYDMGNSTVFEQTLDDILEQIKPLYEQLHAYVRGRLCEIYPGKFDCNGSIPAHILGSMWAQQWQDRLDDILPYPESPLVNLTKILYEKGYTIDDMYKAAEGFFTSINLYPMSDKFWARSLFVKPTDRQVVCNPSASNMEFHDDYRVKICTEINDNYYYTIHHELGHVEYYMSYEHKQPYRYRQGANIAFHEAIGDTIGMYAISPTHFVKLGFLNESDIDSKYEINFLMRMAMQKVAFLPFGYALDKYRFALFRNEIDRPTELNKRWWQMRVQYGGIQAPVPRHDPENFDPGAKYHVPANVPYAKYFISHILQFQFHRALCRLQGDTERLHMCDIYGNKYVGKRFRRMLALGSSKRWPDVLKTLTDETQLEPKAILDYFKPLYEWLKTENAARGYPVGW